MVRKSKYYSIMLAICITYGVMQNNCVYSYSEINQINAGVEKSLYFNDEQNQLLPSVDLKSSNFKLEDFYNINFALWNDKFTNAEIVSPFDSKNMQSRFVSPANINTANTSQVLHVSIGNKQNASISALDEEKTSLKFGYIKELISNKNYTQALSILDAISSNNYTGWEFAELATYYDKLGKTENAIKCYQKALVKNPDRIEILYAYSNCLIKNNNLNLAEINLLKIIKINPEFMLAYFNLGNINFKKHEYEKALVWFNQSAKTNPMCADAYYNSAVILELLNHRAIALNYYKKYSQLKPSDISVNKTIQRLSSI